MGEKKDILLTQNTDNYFTFPKHSLSGLNHPALLTHIELLTKNPCVFPIYHKAKSILSYSCATRLLEQSGHPIIFHLIGFDPWFQSVETSLCMLLQGNAEWVGHNTEKKALRHSLNQLISTLTVQLHS